MNYAKMITRRSKSADQDLFTVSFKKVWQTESLIFQQPEVTRVNVLFLDQSFPRLENITIISKHSWCHYRNAKYLLYLSKANVMQHVLDAS